MLDRLKFVARGGFELGRSGERGQVDTVLTIVTLGLLIIIGILVYGEVDQAIPSPSNNDLANAQSNSTDDFGDAMELAPVILIVLIASVVIGVVSRFR